MKPVETRAFDIGFKRPPCMRRSGVLSVSGCFFWYVPPDLFFETQRHRVTEGKDALDFRLRTPWTLCLRVSNVRA